ncbi:MAG: SurA N-terminal domain-containing protein, partial [Proteobacteria bacterium]|nr:SurA N-terminal domain-containing protein [Pseudomonadota bacterium]
MLDRIRKGSGGWLAKILLGMLILSFGVWGIGDIFRGGGNSVVAEVGDVQIGTADYSRAYQAELRQQSQRFGRSLDAATARQIGLPQRAFQQLLFDTLLSQAASKYGLAVSDNAVKRVVQDIPAFQYSGRFDRDLMQRILQRNGVTEEEYLQTVRQDIAREELVQSLLVGRAAPDGFVDPIVKTAFGVTLFLEHCIDRACREHHRSVGCVQTFARLGEVVTGAIRNCVVQPCAAGIDLGDSRFASGVAFLGRASQHHPAAIATLVESPDPLKPALWRRRY